MTDEALPTIEMVGCVTRFFAEPSVAVVALTLPLGVGDLIYVKGRTTDFQQRVASLQFNHLPVDVAAAGTSVGVQMNARCRRHDAVYCIRTPLTKR